MRKTRLHFKHLLIQCQQREYIARADVMATSIMLKIQSVFGEKNISKSYKKGIPNASNVSGANDLTAISAMWEHILNLC